MYQEIIKNIFTVWQAALNQCLSLREQGCINTLNFPALFINHSFPKSLHDTFVSCDS